MESEKDVLLQLVQDLQRMIEQNSNEDGTVRFDVQQGKLGILYAKLQIEKSIEAYYKEND